MPAGRGEPSPTIEVPTGQTPTVEVPELLARPVALPTLAPGSPCPTTPTTTIVPGTGTGFSGPVTVQQAGAVSVAFAGEHVVLRPEDLDEDGWYSIKDVWLIGPEYDAPLLVRGGRIDEDGSMRIAWNPTTSAETALEIGGGAPSLQADPSTGCRSVPMEVFVRGPGCYAYQLDGVGFTERIVSRHPWPEARARSGGASGCWSRVGSTSRPISARTR